MDVRTLYDEILRPAAIGRPFEKSEEGICIWKEHVRTSIIRTIIECSSRFVYKERKAKFGETKGETVVVVCPTEELHELGAKMVADFFTLCGYDVTFVGANTPQSQVLAGIGYVVPAYVAISVTNHYNLVAARKLVDNMKTLRTSKGLSFKIIVGGSAFERNPELAKEIGADQHLHGFDDIKALKGGA